jgi:hypothetical protein
MGSLCPVRHGHASKGPPRTAPAHRSRPRGHRGLGKMVTLWLFLSFFNFVSFGGAFFFFFLKEESQRCLLEGKLGGWLPYPPAAAHGAPAAPGLCIPELSRGRDSAHVELRAGSQAGRKRETESARAPPTSRSHAHPAGPRPPRASCRAIISGAAAWRWRPGQECARARPLACRAPRRTARAAPNKVKGLTPAGARAAAPRDPERWHARLPRPRCASGPWRAPAGAGWIC